MLILDESYRKGLGEVKAVAHLGDPRKRRDRLFIIAEILSIAKDGTLKTQIMYRANLSFTQLNSYLQLLLELKLLEVFVENDRTVYKTSEKGCKYLESYKEILQLLQADDKPSLNNLPIHWLKDLYP